MERPPPLPPSAERNLRNLSLNAPLPGPPLSPHHNPITHRAALHRALLSPPSLHSFQPPAITPRPQRSLRPSACYVCGGALLWHAPSCEGALPRCSQCSPPTRAPAKAGPETNDFAYLLFPVVQPNPAPPSDPPVPSRCLIAPQLIAVPCTCRPPLSLSLSPVHAARLGQGLEPPWFPAAGLVTGTLQGHTKERHAYTAEGSR